MLSVAGNNCTGYLVVLLASTAETSSPLSCLPSISVPFPSPLSSPFLSSLYLLLFPSFPFLSSALLLSHLHLYLLLNLA